MSEWWTYRPSDFLMFAPDTYWRQFELHNTALWPFQLLPPVALLALAAAIVAGPGKRSEMAMRWGLAGLAVCWGFVAWSFLWQRYAPINWAAQAFAIGFVAQALGLLGLTSVPGLRTTPQSGRRLCALFLIAWAALLHPLLAPAFDRPLAQAELFGVAPDPTVVATLGWLLVTDARSRARCMLLWALTVLALAWCAISAATLWTMGSAQGWVMLAAAVVSLGALWRWPYGQQSGR
ncbi:DUF6064 family protein [Hydrogenophaga sp.]|uniref:DUF6064 family protein n=1 Tax=Hydrogenophaga sp. TaxID=1904254 RepID=UPI0027257124|nr:DUF6064 family protein [Hydrogenophaga sp.]MDO8906515.1 DUF6064 family protein [Hydrogenophaga sp.]